MSPSFGMCLRVLLFCGVVCVVFPVGPLVGCRPGPQVEKPEEPGEPKAPVEVVPEPAAEPAPPRDAAAPEPSRPEPPGPEPRPEPPPVPEKVLVTGIDVIVVHVTDGDTLYVVKKPGGWASRSRLKGINAPECKKKTSSNKFLECSDDDEFYGLESYKIAKKLAMGTFRKAKLVCLMKNGECEKGEFGRYLIYLELPDGKDLGEEILKAGGAWSFTRFTAKKMPQYCKAEADAVRAKAGMWSRGRDAVRNGMSNDSRSWYYHRTKSKSHDGICSKEMGEDFAKRAGE